MAVDFSSYRTDDIIKNLKSEKLLKPFDIVITGVTGAGKSTTINALLKNSAAKVGIGVDPETKTVDSYDLSHFIRLWDSPGLGDGVAQDKVNIKLIEDTLLTPYLPTFDSWPTSMSDYEKKGSKEMVFETLINAGFIGLFRLRDLVLVVIEGSNKDMGMTYKLLNDVVKHYIRNDRILVAVNQADVAMKCRGWNSDTKSPDNELLAFLEQQAASIQRRIKETCELTIPKPIYYSAQYDYNVDKLFDAMVNMLGGAKTAT